jgi:hypothetical protein
MTTKKTGNSGASAKGICVVEKRGKGEDEYGAFSTAPLTMRPVSGSGRNDNFNEWLGREATADFSIGLNRWTKFDLGFG